MSAKASRRGQEDASLNITSMMDIMTIILIFLLKNYSTEDISVAPSDDLQVPVSSAVKPPKLAVSVVVSRKDIVVDGLWVIDLEGGEPRALSDESFRLLNSPAWSPDGAFVAGRKHFTKSRSLGSGEIWIYPVDGPNGGLQLTERPDEQKDVGEPAFAKRRNGDA